MTVLKPSSDRRWHGAMSVIELIFVKRFLRPTTKLQVLLSVEILKCKRSICDRNVSWLMKVLYICFRASCIDIKVVVQFTVSTFREDLEEYTFCS